MWVLLDACDRVRARTAARILFPAIQGIRADRGQAIAVKVAEPGSRPGPHVIVRRTRLDCPALCLAPCPVASSTLQVVVHGVQVVLVAALALAYHLEHNICIAGAKPQREGGSACDGHFERGREMRE